MRKVHIYHSCTRFWHFISFKFICFYPSIFKLSNNLSFICTPVLLLLRWINLLFTYVCMYNLCVSNFNGLSFLCVTPSLNLLFILLANLLYCFKWFCLPVFCQTMSFHCTPVSYLSRHFENSVFNGAP